MNPFELMLDGDEDSFKYKKPDFPQGSLDKNDRTIKALAIADTVRAIQACYIQEVYGSFICDSVFIGFIYKYSR